jgi:hypothetical protein
MFNVLILHTFPFLLSFPIITSYLRSSSFPLQNILRFNIFFTTVKKTRHLCIVIKYYSIKKNVPRKLNVIFCSTLSEFENFLLIYYVNEF